MIERLDAADRIDHALAADPMDPIEAKDPMEPTDRMLPTDPIDRIEPRLPMLRIDRSDFQDQRDVEGSRMVGRYADSGFARTDERPHFRGERGSSRWVFPGDAREFDVVRARQFHQ